MDRDLFRAILRGLAALRAPRHLLLALQNEPLLDPDLGARMTERSEVRHHVERRLPDRGHRRRVRSPLCRAQNTIAGFENGRVILANLPKCSLID